MAARGPYYAVGLYVCKVVNQAMGESKSGNSHFRLVVEVLGKPSPTYEESGEYEAESNQYERSLYFPLTEKTIGQDGRGWVFRTLHDLGYKSQSLGGLDPESPHHESFVGRFILCWCKHETRQDGTLGESWQVSSGKKALDNKPMESKKLRQLDAIFGKSVASFLGEKGKTPRKSLEEELGVVDDDIPF